MSARRLIGVFPSALLVLVGIAFPGGAQGAFGIQSFSVKAERPDGSIETQAGSHPDIRVSIAFNLESGGAEEPEGKLNALFAHLPPGLVGNIQSVPKCPRSVFASAGQCPSDTVVGVAFVDAVIAPDPAELAIYNLAPPAGSPATLAGTVFELNSFQEASLQSESDFGVDISDVTLPASAQIRGIEEVIWGAPYESRHDEERGESAINGRATGNPSPAPYEGPPLPFITLPTSCKSSLKTTVEVESLEEPGNLRSASVEAIDGTAGPGHLTGCDSLRFEPTIVTRPTTTSADSPTGLDVRIRQPQEPSPSFMVGAAVSCESGKFFASPAAQTYRWLRNGAPIEGASSQTAYTVSAADSGAALQCEETVETPAGATRALSRPVAIPPAPETPLPSPEPPPPGGSRFPRLTFTLGTFACESGSWLGQPTFTYSWYKNGTQVPGEAGSTYVVPGAQLPATVQCKVTGTNGVGASSAYTTNRSSTPPPATTPPQLEGFPQVIPAGAYPVDASAALDDVIVTLPEGMTLNPAAANGLSSCTEAQVGRLAVPGIHFSKVPQSCPNASKVGLVEASTPLLDHTVHGAVYVADPFKNPFGTLLAVYLVIEDEITGTYVKLAGRVDPNPATGQLTAVFADNPQLPIEDIELHFFGGDRGTLKTPLTCGAYSARALLTPWSAPEAPPASLSSSFAVSAPASGAGACPTSEAGAPKSFGFEAGTTSAIAGTYSPFVLKLTRADGSQHLTGISTILPDGLLGSLAGILYCPESGIATAVSREAPEDGKLEQSSPSCPQASEVGTVTVGAGAGGSPFFTSGRAYLAGPYKGAPLSLVVIVPAVAGPFDLGDVVSRVALNVAPYSARIEAVSDPLPTIIQGIPLDVRSISLGLNRSNFTLNPTSCEAKQIEGTVTTQAGQTAALANRFQVAECGKLKFKPSLALSLKGPTKRAGHPAVKAVVTYPKKGGYANIAKAQVSLPHSEFLDQGNIGKTCTQSQLKAKTCPKTSIYGRVKAWTPLLEKPLVGNVYLGVGFGYKLPAIVAELNGQIRVLLASKVDTDKQGGIRNTFETVPDAPVEKFVLELKGGKKYGLLENSENICKKKQVAGVSFRAQNGRILQFSTKIANECSKNGKGKKKAHGGKSK